MKKAYTPTSSIHPVFTGPYRILELYPTGALLKCPRTGEIFSTHFKHIRKLNLEEFTTILPTHFDSDILKQISNFRYNTKGQPEKIKKSTSPIQDDIIQEKLFNPEDNSQMKLRSGKIISINVKVLRKKDQNISNKIFYSYNPRIVKKPEHLKSILKTANSHYIPAFNKYDQKWTENIWMFNSTLSINHIRYIEPEYKKRKKKQSSFQSPFQGTLLITLDPTEEENHNPRTVKFSSLTVHFY